MSTLGQKRTHAPQQNRYSITSLVRAGELAKAGSPLCGNVRIDFLRGADVGIAARNIALELLGFSTQVERGGVVGIDPDRLIEVGHGAIEFALGLVRGAAVAESGGVIGIKPDCFRVVGDSVVVVLPI